MLYCCSPHALIVIRDKKQKAIYSNTHNAITPRHCARAWSGRRKSLGEVYSTRGAKFGSGRRRGILIYRSAC
jgi:hypothetical protein